MKKGFRLYLPLLLSIFLVSGCSGGGTTPNTPNTTNLANLAKKPTTGNEIEIKKINLTGRVIDAVTRKPIDNANVLVYVISNDDIIKDVKNNNKPEAFASPQVSGSPSAPAIGTPLSNVIPAAPVAPTVLPSPKPAPVYEEEEVTKPSVKPTSALVKPVIKASIKPTVKKTVKPIVKVSPKASKINVKGLLTPKVAPSITPVKTDEINEKDIISSLTKIKMNDIQEFETKTGNDGKYWINKVPDSSMIITISADNYRSVSVFNAEANKVEDISLMPLDADKYYSSISGAVVSANNNSLENASVSSSYVVGDSFNIPTTTNISGDFTLEDLSVGERMLVASSKDETGKISAMGFFDVDVKKDSKAYKQKKVTPTKDDPKVKEVSDKKDATDVKKEESKRDKDALLIKSKAVTEYISIKGKVDSKDKDKDIVLKNVSIYINFKKKGLPKEEIFFTEKEFTKAEDTFELELPKLENVYSYRLEFTGVNKKGFRVYHNEVGIKKDQKELKVSFMSPISIGKLDFIKKEESNLPIFIWNPVEGASFYKVTLDKQDKNNNISTVWEGITPFNTAIYPITTGDSKIKLTNTYFWSVSAIKDSEKTEKLSFGKVGLANASDVSVSPVMDFKLNSKDEEIEEIDKKKEG